MILFINDSYEQKNLTAVSNITNWSLDHHIHNTRLIIKKEFWNVIYVDILM